MRSSLRRRRPVELGAMVPRDEIRQAVALEEVAEAVLDGDLGDLGHAPEVARGRLGHPAIVREGPGRPGGAL